MDHRKKLHEDEARALKTQYPGPDTDWKANRQKVTRTANPQSYPNYVPSVDRASKYQADRLKEARDLQDKKPEVQRNHLNFKTDFETKKVTIDNLPKERYGKYQHWHPTRCK